MTMTSAKPAVLRPSEIPARQRGGGAKTIPLVTRRTGGSQRAELSIDRADSLGIRRTFGRQRCGEPLKQPVATDPISTL